MWYHYSLKFRVPIKETQIKVFVCCKAWTASVRKSHQWQYCSKVNKLSSIMEVESSGFRICSVWSRSFRQSDRPNVPLLSAEQLPWLISSDGFYHDYCRALYTTPTLCILYAVTMYGCQDSMHTGRGREGWRGVGNRIFFIFHWIHPKMDANMNMSLKQGEAKAVSYRAINNCTTNYLDLGYMF